MILIFLAPKLGACSALLLQKTLPMNILAYWDLFFPDFFLSVVK